MKSAISTLTTIVLAGMLTTAWTTAYSPGPAADPTVVFVCEHGAAKSVIATAVDDLLKKQR